MFTGIIQAVGRIRDNEEIGDGLRIHVEAPELRQDRRLHRHQRRLHDGSRSRRKEIQG